MLLFSNPPASAQQQSQATCDALTESINNAAQGANRGVCTVNTECLVISCTDSVAGDLTVTIFPCEGPIVVNFRFVGSGTIDENITETTSIPIGLGSAINVIVDPLPDGSGITFGVSQWNTLFH